LLYLNSKFLLSRALKNGDNVNLGARCFSELFSDEMENNLLYLKKPDNSDNIKAISKKKSIKHKGKN
jgi:hypothetical protein